MKRLVLLFALIASSAFGSSSTIGPNGINSKATGLDGSLGTTFGVGLGMAEEFRSGKSGYDSASMSAPNTIPDGVYYGSVGSMAAMDQWISPDDHATEVAGVMIGKAQPSATYEGVAPGARLHSLGVENFQDDAYEAVALNSLALLNVTPEIVAINLSWGAPIEPFIEEDGRSHITQFIDWSARVHDVLYVVAWPNSDEFPPTKPDDNFNGMTVGASGLNGGSYEVFAGTNADPPFIGFERTYIDLLAPGEDIQVYGRNGTQLTELGTSFAAPHVTGAVALLHQYRDQQAMAGNERFFGTPKHYTTKAILMNSADKLGGVHGSSRDVTNHLGQKWDQTTAHLSATVPIDAGMGTGHVNVGNAVTQMSAGRYLPTGGSEPPSPAIGWSEFNVSPGETVEYVIDAIVPADEWIAITLCWDRVLEHSGGSTYQFGDQFFPYADPYDRMPDLNLYLLAMDNSVIASSTSTVHNEEHIFYRVTSGGQFKIAVSNEGGLDSDAGYGLAWSFGEAALPIPGDYNKNGSVGPEDYDVWKSNFGTSFADADGNSDGTVNSADYTVWRNHLGDSLGAGSAGVSPSHAAVPEPAALALAVFGLAYSFVATRHPFLRTPSG